jgi:hypothetical protein
MDPSICCADHPFSFCFLNSGECCGDCCDQNSRTAPASYRLLGGCRDSPPADGSSTDTSLGLLVRHTELCMLGNHMVQATGEQLGGGGVDHCDPHDTSR